MRDCPIHQGPSTENETNCKSKDLHRTGNPENEVIPDFEV